MENIMNKKKTNNPKEKWVSDIKKDNPPHTHKITCGTYKKIFNFIYDNYIKAVSLSIRYIIFFQILTIFKMMKIEINVTQVFFM